MGARTSLRGRWLVAAALATAGCDGGGGGSGAASAAAAVTTATAAPVAPVASATIDAASGRVRLGFPSDVQAEVVGAQVRVRVDGTWVEAADYPSRAVTTAGATTRLVASGLAGRPDLTLELTPAGTDVLAVVRAANRTGAPVRVQGFELGVRPGEGGWARLGARPADSTLWVQGQQSWTFAGTVAVRPGPVEADAQGGTVPDEELFALGDNVNDLTATAGLVARGRDAIPLSWWNVVVEEPDHGRGLLAGAVTAARFKTSALVGFDPAVAAALPAAGQHAFTTFRVVSGLTGDEVALTPGAEVASEQLVVGVHPSGREALRAHADLVAARMTVLPRSGGTGARRIGWSTWSCFYEQVDERGVLDQARAIAGSLPGFEVIQLDDGYEVAWGDWRPNARFPSGIDGFARAVKGLGLVPGIWIAPFLVDEGLPVVQQHPDWFLRDPRGQPIFFTIMPGKPRKRPLDLTHPDAAAFARANLAALRAAGVEVFKTDFLFAAAYEGLHHDPTATGLTTFHAAMRLIRDAVGPDATVIGIASPWLATAGAVDFYRQSFDVETSFLGPVAEFFEAAARGTIARAHVHGRWFGNDPDHVIVQPPLPLDEARLNATYAALCGGVYLLGDDVLALGSQRLSIASHPELLAIVREGRAAEPLDLFEARNARVAVEPTLMTLSRFAGVGAYPLREVPSVWRLERPAGGVTLAVFNWSDRPRQRSFPLSALRLSPGSRAARDVWTGAPRTVSDPLVVDQPARSVTVLQLAP